MNLEDFKKNGHELVDWMYNYFKDIETYPVKSSVNPGEIKSRISLNPPDQGEDFNDIMQDFNSTIIPGITHWQHPSFFAYFNANNSFPSILAEMLTSAIGAQCMSWATSPAATELEERVMEWLCQLLGLPEYFTGVIQDTASTSTLCSLLTAREKFSKYEINQTGFYDKNIFTIYCSEETHSSVEKAVKIAGFGKNNLRKIKVDNNFAMRTDELEAKINQDIQCGFIPLLVVATIGTTGSTAVDPLNEIGKLASKYNIWLHVDAAYGGTAMLLPEMRKFIEGITYADTFVFNPHKWMFTNFDCSAYFVKDKEALIRTFEILPEYLKTNEKERVSNFRDWGIQLGRRFRALKLWFVIRSFGKEKLQEKIQNHIKWAKELGEQIKNNPDFELMAPINFATVCFRYKPVTRNKKSREELNNINAILLEKLNTSGKLYLTHTKLRADYVIRFVVGQTNCQKEHINNAWKIIQEYAHDII